MLAAPAQFHAAVVRRVALRSGLIASLLAMLFAAGAAAASSVAQIPGSTSAVGVGVNASNDYQYVFWRGGDGRIYEAWHTTGWRGPSRMPWSASSAPGVAVTLNGNQYVFWQGANRHIYEAWFRSTWHGPRDLTSSLRWGERGQTLSAPGVGVNPSNGHQYLFWRGLDGRIHEAWYTEAWHGPVNMGWSSASAPAVAVNQSAHQYVFWRGDDGQIFESWFTSAWHGPRDLTSFHGWAEFGESESAIGAAVNPAGSDQYLFWRGMDGRMYESWYTNAWHGPANIGWSPTSAPGAGVTTASHQYVFWQGGDGAIWEAWHTSGWNGPITPVKPAPGPGALVEVVQTTADLSQRMSRLSNVRFGGSPPAGVSVIDVNATIRYQRITGVGGAMTDTSAWLIYDQLDSATRAGLMNDLFGASGIRSDFTLVPMAASDFTRNGRPYTYDDMPAGATDPSLAHFSTSHDQAYILPALRQMRATNPATTVFAVPWTAPPWMKANKAYDNLHHAGSLLASAYQPFANYFVKFIQSYAAQGVPVTAIAPVNEPRGAAAFPSMDFPVANEAQWIARDLEPALQQAQLSPALYGADAAWGNPSYANTLASSQARGALHGIAWHCYSGIPTVMGDLHPQLPSGDQMVTECSPGISPFPVPEVLIGAARNWSSAVTLWNLALDPSGGPVQPPNSGCRGCTGLVTINEATHRITFNLPYFQLGQLGVYVRAGAWRIGSNTFVSFYQHSSSDFGVTSGVDNAAFLNPDGTRVLVAYNNSSGTIRFAVRWANRAFTYSLPSRAMVTFRWKPG